jgi:hypothetical protein
MSHRGSDVMRRWAAGPIFGAVPDTVRISEGRFSVPIVGP